MKKGKKIEWKDLIYDVGPPPEDCPRCNNGKMVGGSLYAGTYNAVDLLSTGWVKKYPEDPTDPECIDPHYPVRVYACRKCGYTELYTDFSQIRSG